MSNTATLRIGGVKFGPTLQLGRLPLYLRFVITGLDWKTLDALDQTDDLPKPEETIIAAKLVGTSNCHVDRCVKGRRVGEWLKMADYERVDPQPSDDEMRDYEKWKGWCFAAAAAEQTGKAAG